MLRFKLLPAAVIGLALSAAVARAEPPTPDSAQPNAAIPSTDRSDGNNLTGRSLVAMGEAANKISDVLSTGALAFGSGVQHVTNQAAELIGHARQAMGVRYRWGGTSTQTGFDCSGFVRAVVQQTVGRLLPHHAADQAAVTQTISEDQLQPGDLVFFNTVRRRAYSHVGIYMGDGQFIHAPRRGESVRIDNLSEAYWQRHFQAARRVLPNQPVSYNLASADDTPGLNASSAADVDTLPTSAPASMAVAAIPPSVPVTAASTPDNTRSSSRATVKHGKHNRAQKHANSHHGNKRAQPKSRVRA